MIEEIELPPPADARAARPNPQPFDPAAPLPGLYAIVEVLGHRRYAGRVSEVQRFGTAFLQIEPLFQDWILPPVLIGGSSLYQFTEVDAATAWDRRAKYAYDLQGGIGAIAASLEPPEPPAFNPRFLAWEEGEPE